jgi:hypothetical protein
MTIAAILFLERSISGPVIEYIRDGHHLAFRTLDILTGSQSFNFIQYPNANMAGYRHFLVIGSLVIGL